MSANECGSEWGKSPPRPDSGATAVTTLSLRVTSAPPYGNLMCMSGNTSGNPATHFGRQIRKERTQRGWSVHELAKRSGLSAAQLSRLETGQRNPTERTAQKLDAVFPERKGWFSDYHHDSQAWTPPGYRHWQDYENRATTVRTWAVGMVHGLAQTPEYARAHLLTVPSVPAEVVSARLQARMERQRLLYERGVPVLHLVDELALYRLMGPPEVMAEQMTRLLDLPRRPDVQVMVVPAVGHAALGSELVITDTGAYTESLAGGYVHADDETATGLRRLADTIMVESYRASESADIIGKVRDLWKRGESPLTALRRGDLA